MTDLYNKVFWVNKNIEYLFNSPIYEYDIKAGGLNIIKYFNLLPEKEIKEIEKKNKKDRVVYIGILQRQDREFRDALQNGFKYIRKLFIDTNNLTENDIISIKNDAFFVIDKKLVNTVFNTVEFVVKNKYTSYMNIKNKEFYINTDTNKIDIKGLGQDEVLDKIHYYHDKYMLKFILNTVRMKEVNSDSLTYYITEFIKDYRAKALDIGFYRELNQLNTYKLYDKELDSYINIEETNDVKNIDITYNYIQYITPIASLCI